MTTQIKIDRDFHALIPPLSGEERSQLEANLIADGCRDPLVKWGETGILLDGHNRHEICLKHGIGFRVVDLGFGDRDAAMAWVIRNQYGRRNLNDFQRSELALKLKSLIEPKARERQSAGGREKVRQNSDEPKRTDAALAADAGVSRDTIRKVEMVIARATPPMVEMARKGEVSINAASKVAKLPPVVQREVVAKGPAAVKEAAAEVRKVEAKRVETELPKTFKEYKKNLLVTRYRDFLNPLRSFLRGDESHDWFERMIEQWGPDMRNVEREKLIESRDRLSKWIKLLEK